MANAPEDLDSLWPQVYDELRRIARARMRSERQGHTLNPTGLVNEVYVRFRRQGITWANRREFLAYARVAMRRILIEYARERNALSRGGDRQRVTLTTANLPEVQPQRIEILAVDEALSRITNPRTVELIELRFFCGFTIDEVADLWGEHKSKVRAQWQAAKGLLITLISGKKDRQND